MGNGPLQPQTVEVKETRDKTLNIIVVRISELRQRLRNISTNKGVKLGDSQIVVCCSETYKEEL